MTASASAPDEPVFDHAYNAANDNNRVRYRGGYPALRWLIKHDPAAALAVFHHIRSASSSCAASNPVPAYLDPCERSVDDAESHDAPDEPNTSLDDLSGSDAGSDDVNVDRLHEVAPELHQLLRSAGGTAWPWCGVRIKCDGKIRWFGEPWAYRWTEVQRRVDRHTFKLGGLTYYTRPATPSNPVRRSHPGGMLVAYVDDNGRLQRPLYRATKPRGGKNPHRTAAAVDRYLKYSSAVPSPMTADGIRTPISREPAIGDFYHPLGRRPPGAFMDWQTGKVDKEGRFGVNEAREYLKHYGVDGNVSFDELPFVATKCATGRAKGARFIAGITASKETKSAPASGTPCGPELRLTNTTATVLDEVAARGNLTRIGTRLGKSKGYADRYGKMALLAAANELLAANRNDSEKIVAA